MELQYQRFFFLVLLLLKLLLLELGNVGCLLSIFMHFNGSLLWIFIMDIYYRYLLWIFITGIYWGFDEICLATINSLQKHFELYYLGGKNYSQTQAWSEIMAKEERRTELPLQTGFPPNFCFLLKQSQRCCTSEFGTFGSDSFLHLISL